MVFALKIWEHDYYGIHVDMFIEHKILRYVFTQKELNLLQLWYLDLLKDYDVSVHFHPSKANVVGDDNSRLSMGSLAHAEEERIQPAKNVHMLADL